jgi:Gas vesicle protein K
VADEHHDRDAPHGAGGLGDADREPTVDVSADAVAAFERELRELAPALPGRIDVDPQHVENGLPRLVLTVIELLRRVLEHQAIRRMDGGSLSEEEVERLGVALLRLSERMEELKAVFGLTDEDLNIDLGPLGRLR